MTMESIQVEYDDLAYTDAHIFVFDGQPFTGIAESRYPNGNLRCRFSFENGKEHGEAEEFFPSGSKRSLTPYVNGAVHGHKIEWFENGLVKIERDVEYGVLMHEKELDETANLINEYVRPENDAMMKFIESRRREAAS